MEIINPFRGDITDQSLIDWIDQFKDIEKPIINKLLKAFKYYGSAQIAELVKGLYKGVLDLTGTNNREIWFVPVGYVAKSGSIIAYYFRVQNGLKQDQFISPSDISSLPLSKKSTIVFLDDFLGTGNQAKQVWKTVAEPIKKSSQCNFIYATLVAFQEGLTHLKTTTEFIPLVVDTLNDKNRPFSNTSNIFSDETERINAEKIIKKYGDKLYPNHPFGYQKSQGLIGFFYSTPNNTLPIFWSAQNGWLPLLARGDSYRDPAFLIGPPPGLSSAMAENSSSAPLKILNQLDEFDIDSESLIQLASEFKDSKVVLVLASIMKKLEVPRNILEYLLKLIRSFRDLRHEKEHVRSALHIVSKSTRERSCGTKIINAAPSTTMDSMSNMEALANMIDGLIGGTLIQADGVVIGNFVYPISQKNEESFLPYIYRRAANASLISGGVVLLFLEGNRIAVFFAGSRVLWHRGAAWHLQSPNFDNGIRELSTKHEIEYPVLKRIIKIAFLLSDSGKGGLITIGDHTRVIENSDPPKTTHIDWIPLDLINSPIEGVFGIMAQDGATIISGGGEIVQAMTTLRPPPGVIVDEETGRGTKHSTASKISKVTNSLCIAISVDGRISLYSEGSIAFKFMG